MAKKKAKQVRRRKAQLKDLKPRKVVKGGIMPTQLGIRGPGVVSAF